MKDIVGFEGFYSIDEYGNVYSNSSGSGVRKGIRKPSVDKDGYNCMILCNKYKKTAIKIHRVVAQLYIPNPLNKPCINHIDGNKQNNHISNLEWCTRSENSKHAYDTGLRKPTDWTTKIHSSSKKVMCIETEEVFDSINIASKKKNIASSSIRHNISGRYKNAGGFTWKLI